MRVHIAHHVEPVALFQRQVHDNRIGSARTASRFRSV
jgi:hypothetical protein